MPVEVCRLCPLSPAPKAKAPFLGAFVFGMDNTNRREARVEPRTRVSALPAEASIGKVGRQRTTLIMSERGAPPKARLSSPAPKRKRTQGGAFFQ